MHSTHAKWGEVISYGFEMRRSRARFHVLRVFFSPVKQSSCLQIKRSRVRFAALLDFLRSSGSGTGSTEPFSTTEELFARESGGSGIENREYGRRDPLCWPCNTLYPQTLALISPTSGGRSVAIVRSRTKATEFVFVLFVVRINMQQLSRIRYLNFSQESNMFMKYKLLQRCISLLDTDLWSVTRSGEWLPVVMLLKKLIPLKTLRYNVPSQVVDRENTCNFRCTCLRNLCHLSSNMAGNETGFFKSVANFSDCYSNIFIFVCLKAMLKLAYRAFLRDDISSLLFRAFLFLSCK
jgi:hypothetical protein